MFRRNAGHLDDFVLSDYIDLLESDDEAFAEAVRRSAEDISIFTEPPAPDAASDGDSGPEDEAGTIDNLSRGLLSAPIVQDNDTALENPPTGSDEWKENDLKVPFFVDAGIENEPDGKSPVELFECFWDNDMIQQMCSTSVLYAVQSGNTSFQVSEDEMRCFVAILLVSGYNNVPARKNYWENAPDIQNIAIKNAMRRDRFIEIMKYLHFTHDFTPDSTDKYWKLRLISDKLQEKFLKHAYYDKYLSYDESMIKYYGRHGCKQFIRGKPIRFGFKVLCLNTRTGYLLAYELYQAGFYP